MKKKKEKQNEKKKRKDEESFSLVGDKCQYNKMEENKAIRIIQRSRKWDFDFLRDNDDLI